MKFLADTTKIQRKGIETLLKEIDEQEEIYISETIEAKEFDSDALAELEVIEETRIEEPDISTKELTKRFAVEFQTSESLKKKAKKSRTVANKAEKKLRSLVKKAIKKQPKFDYNFDDLEKKIDELSEKLMLDEEVEPEEPEPLVKDVDGEIDVTDQITYEVYLESLTPDKAKEYPSKFWLFKRNLSKFGEGRKKEYREEIEAPPEVPRKKIEAPPEEIKEVVEGLIPFTDIDRVPPTEIKVKTATGRVFRRILDGKSGRFELGDSYLCLSSLYAMQEISNEIGKEGAEDTLLGDFYDYGSEKIQALARALALRYSKDKMEDSGLAPIHTTYRELKKAAAELRITDSLNDLCFVEQKLPPEKLAALMPTLKEWSDRFDIKATDVPELMKESKKIQDEIDRLKDEIEKGERVIKVKEIEVKEVKEESKEVEEKVKAARSIEELKFDLEQESHKLHDLQTMTQLQGLLDRDMVIAKNKAMPASSKHRIKIRDNSIQEILKKYKKKNVEALTVNQQNELEKLTEKKAKANKGYQALLKKEEKKWTPEKIAKVKSNFFKTAIKKTFPHYYAVATKKKSEKLFDMIPKKEREDDIKGIFTGIKGSPDQLDKLWRRFDTEKVKKIRRLMRGVLSPSTGSPAGLSKTNIPKKDDLLSVARMTEIARGKAGLEKTGVPEFKTADELRDHIRSRQMSVDLSIVPTESIFEAARKEVFG